PCQTPGCPLLQPEMQREFADVRKRSGAFSQKLGDFLQDLEPEGRAAWLRTALSASRELFQPWTLEVLYEGPSRHSDHALSGKTDDNWTVNFSGDPSTPRGSILPVRISAAGHHTLKGEAIA
ncbi:MAG: TRAM domain-containing protein, partial [Acidobacteria bacterium]|nr:TRAM domain-containing protein [Acidobacteriota bacterium]